MSKILLPFFIFLWSVSGSEIRKIKGVEGQIKSINFDIDYNNSYIVSNYNQSEWFYKLDDEQNIILTKKFYKVSNVLINSENDVYVFSYDATGSTYTSIWFLKNNSKKFKLTSYFKRPNSPELNAFIDSDDNIFFNTKYGVAMLKPRQNIPLAISNFENKFFTRYLVDDSGDVYFKTITENGNTGTSIVNSDAKNQSVPTATDVNYFKGEETDSSQANKNSQAYIGRFGTYIYTNSRPNQYTSPEYDEYGRRRYNSYSYSYTTTTKYDAANRNKGAIKKLNENSEDILLSEYDAIYKILHETDNRLFLLSEKSGDYYNIYYITRDDNIAAIKEVFMNPQINSSLCTSDKDGNVYFAYRKSIISLKENASESTNIDIPSDKDVSYILVDDNNNLWVSAGDLYIVRNETDSATWLYSLPMGVNPLMKENKLTNEIFVASQNGLFVCKN